MRTIVPTLFSATLAHELMSEIRRGRDAHVEEVYGAGTIPSLLRAQCLPVALDRGKHRGCCQS
jgi:hypothetical protein